MHKHLSLASIPPVSFPAFGSFQRSCPRPNVEIAYLTGPAVAAVQRAVEDTGVAELTLEQVEAKYATQIVVHHAGGDLSPGVYSAFLTWAEHTSNMLTGSGEDEDDAATNTDVAYCDTLLGELVAVPAQNAHDVALQAHLLAMSERYGMAFGRIAGQHQPKAQEAKDRDLLQRLGFRSQLCDALDELATAAARLSGTTAYWSAEVGTVVYETFKSAHAEALFPPIDKPAIQPSRGELSIIRSMTRCIIAHAEALLSPAMYQAFLRFGETGAQFRTRWEGDEEGDRRCQAHSDATCALGQTPGGNMHDIALKAYILALEIEDAAPLGPRTFQADGFNVDQVMQGLAGDASKLSPLPSMLHRLMEYAEACSETTTNLSAEVGGAIRAAFQEAIDGDVDAAANRAFDHPDARLLRGFAMLQEGARDFMEGDLPADDEEEEARGRALIEAEDIVMATPAETIAGIVAKMRLAFVHEFEDAAASWALADPNNPAFVFTLEKRRKERWDAIENLARIGGVDLTRRLPL